MKSFIPEISPELKWLRNTGVEPANFDDEQVVSGGDIQSTPTFTTFRFGSKLEL